MQLVATKKDMRFSRQYDFQVRKSVFSNGTHVMGILNVTPDSFFAGSRHAHDAVETARRFIEQGAEIIDVGGQSTRPGSARVSAIEEMARVLPAVESIRKEFADVPISVDTFYPDVAQAALDSGADMINDVSCLADENLADVIARCGASVCVMHNRRDTKIKDLFLDKEIGLQNAVDKLLRAGVDKRKILLDGGIGFNKNNAEDWELLNGYDKLIDAFDEYPFLLGTSRKSMFGGDVDSRLSATLESTALAVKQGVLFVRVHDVKENVAMINCTRTR